MQICYLSLAQRGFLLLERTNSTNKYTFYWGNSSIYTLLGRDLTEK